MSKQNIQSARTEKTSLKGKSNSNVDYAPKEQLYPDSKEKITVQRRLVVEAVDNLLEREADDMADKVMHMQETPTIQRKCTDCEEEEKLQRKPLASFIQKKDARGGTVVSDSLSNQINSSRGKGSGLSGNTKNFMENRFGSDFSNVSIHIGGEAIQMNRELNAKAFTVGNDIYFNKGQYNQGSTSGKHLLAHELTHVVQQNGKPAQNIQKQDKEDSIPLDTGGDNDKLPSTGPFVKKSSCSQSSKASSYVASPKNSMGKPITVNLRGTTFGNTSKLAAFFQFGACKNKSSWRFYLDKLVVTTDSKVQPIDFRINVSSANDKSVTKTSFQKVIKDLSPTRRVKMGVSCAGNKFVDEVSSYSLRKEFWNHQFVIDHEAFHQKDWDDTYRPNLVKAEKQIWGNSLPDTAAATASDAITKANINLTRFMTDAYQETCKTFTPKKESRAYDNGAPQYQKLVDEIDARAKTEKW